MMMCRASLRLLVSLRDEVASILHKRLFRVDFIPDGGKAMLIKHTASQQNGTLCFTALYTQYAPSGCHEARDEHGSFYRDTQFILVMKVTYKTTLL